MEKGIILLSLHGSRLLPEFKKELEAAGGGRDILISTSQTEIESFLDKIEIAMGDVPFELVPRFSKLKWLQLWSAGADFLRKFPACIDMPFQLTTTSGMHRQQIAEHLFAMLLGWNRCLPAALTAQRRHEWRAATDRHLSVLNGKTMLIAGYGDIGEGVARIALAFGVRVIGVKRDLSRGAAIDGVRLEEVSKLSAVLGEADYVVNILPSTPDTRHIFDGAQFSLMKSSALYINIGRGATTDQAALISALSTRRIAGALLDVSDPEPLPENSPLWEMDNVMITAHYAGSHPNYSRIAMNVALENMERYNRGQPLENLVDKRKGY